MRLGVQEAKQRAAERALEFVQDGMRLGLGTGSTATLVLYGLAQRLASGLRIVGVPTSRATAELAQHLGIPLTSLDEHPQLDLALDGADEIDPQGQLIKGLGGALWREKIVAASSARFVVVADESKLVHRLGERAPLPVEIAAFGVQATIRRIESLGCRAVLRQHDERLFHTDGGNVIADCFDLDLADARHVERALREIPGVVETGLFLDFAPTLVIGSADGARVVEPASRHGPPEAVSEGDSLRRGPPLADESLSEGRQRSPEATLGARLMSTESASGGPLATGGGGR